MNKRKGQIEPMIVIIFGFLMISFTTIYILSDMNDSNNDNNYCKNICYNNNSIFVDIEYIHNEKGLFSNDREDIAYCECFKDGEIINIRGETNGN